MVGELKERPDVGVGFLSRVGTACTFVLVVAPSLVQDPLELGQGGEICVEAAYALGSPGRRRRPVS